MEWMIYGANGYTGQLMVEQALKRGMQPILAGRSHAPLEALAQRYHLPARVFELDKPEAVRVGLSGVGAVLHCAGPFSKTSAPMLQACLEVGAHYLDITGEIDVFAHAHSLDAQAKQRGIVLVPGVGFDVVPTDCLAAILKLELPTANSLVLGFDAPGGPSPGTAKTALEGMAKGGCVRVDGVLQRVPLAWKTRYFDKDNTPRLAVSIPWGDVYTAYISTAIANIEVYMCVPPEQLARMKQWRHFGPLLKYAPVQNFLKARLSKKIQGPSEQTRNGSETWIWGEAQDAQGRQVSALLKTPNGYTLTVSAALGVVTKLLAAQRPIGGFYTPSQFMGADYVLRLPGVKRVNSR